MTKRIEVLKKTIWTVVTGSMMVALLFTVGCDDGGGDDPEPELYDLSGVYIFEEAILQTTINIPGLPIPIPAGTDITDEMAGGLLAEAPCKDPENGAVELKSDKKLFFTCRNEDNELSAGTWNVDDDYTELTLNLSISTGNLAMKIEDLEINETTNIIGGSIKNFPITKDLIAGFLVGIPGADGILAGIDDDFTVLVTVDIKFMKVS